ncbi:MAG: ATP-grasp domain-containing protein, partial [Aestuariivirgaceae bacterium]
DEQIDMQCRKIAEELDLKGSINVQLRRTADGPRIFEINARFSSTALIRHRMGFQDVVWTLQERMGEAVSCFVPVPGTTGVRTSDAAIVPAE